MSIETPRSEEIKRLTSPITFKDFKAYDSEGNLLKCSETLSDVRFIVEPRVAHLSDNEILQYAPDCKTASKIRLKRGFGNIQDILLIHESLPWIAALYYVVLICISVPFAFSKFAIGMYASLVLFIVPLIYLYFVFNIKRYVRKTVKPKVKNTTQNKQTIDDKEVIIQKQEDTSVESLKKYEKQIIDLNVLFDVKEEVVCGLIEKRFEPPQLTYDKFMSSIDSCRKLFDSQSKSALNIIHMAADDTPRVQNEIETKINAMKTIINQIEELTNELVINISSSQESPNEVNNLLEDMENLISSVKDY